MVLITMLISETYYCAKAWIRTLLPLRGRKEPYESCKSSAKPFNGYFPGSRREYLGFIRLVLKYADTVCFTVCPYLDNPGELGSSIWSCLSDSVLDYGFAQAVSYPPDVRHCLVLFRKDYCLCEFLQSRKGIFDFEEEDPVLGIRLEDPAFLKNGEIFCYTVTHELSLIHI